LEGRNSDANAKEVKRRYGREETRFVANSSGRRPKKNLTPARPGQAMLGVSGRGLLSAF
jgi:hypothetical protein